MNIWTKTLIGLPIVGAIFSTAGTNSQTTDGIYYKSDRWTVREVSGQYCELNLTDSPGFSLTFAVEGSGLLKLLRVKNPRFDREGRDPRAVTWKFDDEALRGRVFSNGEYEPFASYPEMIENFRKARNLRVLHEGNLVADVSLKGSSKAYSKLDECARQWPNGSIPVVPDIDPKPKTAGQFSGTRISTNRKPVPINPAAWIIPTDYKTSWAKAGLQGTVSFMLRIDADGLVDNCTISGGSAPAELKDASCRLIHERARFKPAMDFEGQAEIGSYFGTVRWGLPSSGELE